MGEIGGCSRFSLQSPGGLSITKTRGDSWLKVTINLPVILFLTA